MSKIEELLKRTQNSTKEGLQIVARYKMRAENNKVAFVQWNKEEMRNDVSYTPIKGIFIGENMQFGAFDQQYGKNGGSYVSTHYFSNKNRISLYSPSGKVVLSGNMDKMIEWEKENRLQFKKIKCLFVLTERGLIEIKTNVSIAIDQLKQHRESLKSNFIILAPKLYNREGVTKSGQGFLGKLADTNPPKYADISVAETIPDNLITDWDMIKIIESWEEYVKGINGVELEEDKVEEKTEEKPINVSHMINQPQNNISNPPTVSETPFATQDDDLPF